MVLVGDGALEPKLRAFVDEHGLAPHVTFAGYQSGAAFVEWLQSLDEVWILGLGNDYSARAAAQARACRVRVIAPRLGALEVFADVVLDALGSKLIAAASQSPAAKEVALAPNREIAQSVMNLYAEARAR
jgi:hypothetical protein